LRVRRVLDCSPGNVGKHLQEGLAGGGILGIAHIDQSHIARIYVSAEHVRQRLHHKLAHRGQV
jgi:hypothetical protein